jgi:hypothetical protein
VSEQLGFNFHDAPSRPALDLGQWREQRRSQIEALARRSGLPIGHAVRVQLACGAALEGRLSLAHEDLWIDERRSVELRLQIGRADFRAAEIESCIRTD